ncbi:glycosyltransferase family 4 protein [Algoriphagus halophytocola]|uniref:Glycosyltransferase family 4 protein n=1 Tax=Algoriphagus halophytocola TaxID=2991499 RepID=A0ABY6ME22_9BACT|nr:MULTISPECIES: glycosyltransferase family 4 protein [unclassified Algoriphagus]UZD22011.1 glycosyltransferase family 4 protein [Algoriphagus sp. TR-M5]WBL43262.1 glycosyltransferase family 4 protein [Algoriphagus sp. TR-M9]
MKILYINSLYSPLIEGGAEISLKLIVEGMKSLGHEVVVLSLMPEKGVKTEQVDGVKVYRAGLQNAYWPYSKAKKNKLARLNWHYQDQSNEKMATVVKEILDTENPDIVSCHNLAGWSAEVWKPIAKAGIPIVQVLHDLYLLCPNSNMFKNEQTCENQCFSCKLLRSNHAEKSKQVSAVVGISNSILQRFIDFGYFSNASKNIIYNTRTIPNPSPKRPRKTEQPIRFGYLGTLSKVKGLEWLIEQFKMLDFGASLSIAGKGDKAYEQHLRVLSSGSAIEFVGYVNSTEFLANIDVLIVPSLWEEPLGMVAIEALANHVPVIANKRGGLQETVKDGVNGLYCFDHSSDSLGAAMRRIYFEPELYNLFSKVARESVAPILDADRLIGEYETVLKQALKKSQTAISK